MKIRQTLTTQQTLDLINGETVGMFNTIILDDDAYSSLRYDLCLGYYMDRSGDKPISQTFRRLIQLKNENPSLTETPDNLIGKVIRNKFAEKWTKQYITLIEDQYNPINDYEHIETTTKNNTDTTTYDTTVENDGNRGFKTSTTFSDTDTDNIYGFNSSSAVPSNSSQSSSTETVTGDKNSNTSHNTETKSGSDARNFQANETKTIKGRNKSSAELIDKELDMRNRQIFFDIVFTDIDSVATIGVYTFEPDEFEPIKEYKFGSITITSNGSYPASIKGFDGFSYVVVDVAGEVLPIYNGEVIYDNT